jgi:hypothetical protein
VLKRLRLENLNKEERRKIEEVCLAYRNIFHLPGERLSTTTAVKHEILLEPGLQPVNLRPYRLPETQREEVSKQVQQLRKGP